MPTAIEIGLAVEEARALHKRGLLLVSLDFSKFFDSIDWGLLDALAEQFGMPANIRGAFSGYFCRPQGEFTIGDTFSEKWITTTCGTSHVDAMRIIWANLASVVLAQSLGCERPVFGRKSSPKMDICGSEMLASSGRPGQGQGV